MDKALLALRTRVDAALRLLWPSADAQRRRGWHRGDTVAALVLIAIALLLFQARWLGQLPFFNHDGDTVQLASYCAALDHPGLFKRDPLLSDPRNFAFYATVQVPLTRVLARLAGDYGTAMLIPLPLLLLAQGLGFYRFGRLLYRNRVGALALALSTFLYYPIQPLADYWGTRAYVMPRDWFQAILPWLLAYLLARRDRPRAWLAAQVMLGLLVYVHPVSAAPWALSLWLGTWFFQPARWRIGRRIGWMAACAAGFFAPAMPFVIRYAGSFSHGQTADYERVYQVAAGRFAAGYLDIPSALSSYWQIVAWPRWPELAAIAAVLVWLWLPRERRKLLAVLAWIAGLAFVGFAVPDWEQAYARAHRLMPAEVDFVRSCRYLTMLLHALCLWPLALGGRFRSRTLGGGRTRLGHGVKALASAAAAAGFLGWQFDHTPLDPQMAYGWFQLRTGHWFAQGGQTELAAALSAVRDRTPPGSKLLVQSCSELELRQHDVGWCRWAASFLASEVRYFSLRPVAFSYKDGGPFAYANHPALLDWEAESRRMGFAPTSALQLGWWYAEGRRLGAEYSLMKLHATGADLRRLGAAVVYANRSYLLVKL